MGCVACQQLTSSGLLCTYWMACGHTTRNNRRAARQRGEQQYVKQHNKCACQLTAYE